MMHAWSIDFTSKGIQQFCKGWSLESFLKHDCVYLSRRRFSPRVHERSNEFFSLVEIKRMVHFLVLSRVFHKC